jgi:hypothetical protein
MAGEATGIELKELHEMLKNDPAMNYIAETFSRLWNALPVQQSEESGIKKLTERKIEENSSNTMQDRNDNGDVNFLKEILC